MATANNKEIILNNNFFVPPGIVDVRQADADEAQTVYTPEDVAVEGATLDESTDKMPMPPTSFQIVDQHVRISADGRAVVDVTLQFPDVSGVENIDVRVTKS
jgi:hypothetical protein